MRKLLLLTLALFPLLFVSGAQFSYAQTSEELENPVTEQEVSPDNVRSDERTVLNSNEVIENDYFATGESVMVSGTVNGDAYVAGGDVIVDGTINGDLMAAGGNVTIVGTVTQDIRVAGGNVTISGKTGGNVTTIGGNIVVNNSAQIDGSLVSGAGTIKVLGPVGKSINLVGGEATFASNVGKDIRAGVEKITVTSNAIINGTLAYWSTQDANISEDATVTGGVLVKEQPADINPEQAQEEAENALRAFITTYRVISLLSTLIVGLLFLHFFPNLTQKVSNIAKTQIAKSFVVGLVALIVTPIVAIVLFVTVVGIPLALALLFAYGIALYISKIFIALAIGQRIALLLNSKPRPAFTLLIGLIAYGIVISIPLVGSLLGMIAAIVGFGAILTYKKEMYSELKKKNLL